MGNLLSNALAYTAEGPIVVRALRDGDMVHVDVADQGPGLTAEEVSRVWRASTVERRPRNCQTVAADSG